MLKKDLLTVVTETLQAKAARKITVIDFRNYAYVCDYFIIATARNDLQRQALIAYVEEAITEAGYCLKNVNTSKEGGWDIIDAYEVVVHIFDEETRSLYGLERLWQDLPHVNY